QLLRNALCFEKVREETPANLDRYPTIGPRLGPSHPPASAGPKTRAPARGRGPGPGRATAPDEDRPGGDRSGAGLGSGLGGGGLPGVDVRVGFAAGGHDVE